MKNMRSRIYLTAYLLLTICISSANSTLIPRWTPPKPTNVSYIDPAHFNRDCITIKFVQDSRIRLRKNGLVSLNGWNLSQFEDVISQSKVLSIQRLFSRPEETLDRERQRGQDRSGKELADLNLYYRVILDSVQVPERFIEELLKLSIIEVAHANPIPFPAEDIDPETDDFTDGQGYLYDAPEGIDAPAAWEIEGGMGEGIKIIDIEGAWTFDHEDLKEEFFIEGGEEGMFVSHGDAVIGIMIGQHNDYGIDGICPDAEIGGRSVYPLGNEWPNVSDAINEVADQLDEGDLYLIELHNAFGGRMSPMETWQENFDAIETTSANGLICMEAGGNGNSDLDAEMYEGRFDPENRHSGAILVGAGAPPSGNYGPDRSRLDFSNYGERVDLQGWGREVTTAGYGDLFFPNNDQRQWYTARFGGTSSATPIVSGAVACIQGIYKARTNGRLLLSSMEIRDILFETGTPQNEEGRQGNIGPRPNLGEAIDHIPFFPCTLMGTVINAATDEPIAGATISTDYNFSATTDSSGSWLIEDALAEYVFAIYAHKIEFHDSILVDLEVAEEETLEINFGLLHSELIPSIDSINSELQIGESEQHEFNISNPGNGVLDWSVDFKYRGDAAHDPWELRQSHQFGEMVDDPRLYGVAYINSIYYVTGANEGNPLFYKFSRDGELIDTLSQPVEDRYGIKELAWDGQLLWGSIRRTVYGMSLDGVVEASFESPYNPTTLITWDPDRELLWVGNTTSDLVGMDRDGIIAEGMEIDRGELRVYGISYYADDADDAPIYIFSKERETNRQTVSKYSFEDNETTFVTYLEPEAGGAPQGAFITDQLDGYSWVFVSVANASVNSGGDRVDIWQLHANTSWAIVDLREGTVNPDAEQMISLTIETANLSPNEYPAQMIFSHNGFGLETVIPIDLTVTALDVRDENESPLPLDYAITAAYPNPFNSTIRIGYSIPHLSQMSLTIYDIKGSLVEEVISGSYVSGYHSKVWDASTMPSGIYFARMQVGEFSQTVKLVLMK